MSYVSFFDLSFHFRNGTCLFHNINASLTGKSAIVGNNGAGKSILAKVIAGELIPSSGTVSGDSVYYSPQFYFIKSGTIASFLNIEAALKAKKRIENGEYAPFLYELMENNWDIEERIQLLFDLYELKTFPLQTPLNTLSGGELAKLSLIRASLSDKKFLIFDEPTNHMDNDGKKIFMHFMETFKSGLTIITHDRNLLRQINSIYELSCNGFKLYGGNYDFYMDNKNNEQRNLEERIGNINSEIKQQQQKQVQIDERSARKKSRGRKKLLAGGMPKIVANAMKSKSEETSSNLIKCRQSILKDKESYKENLYREIEYYKSDLHIITGTIPQGKKIFSLQDIKLLYGTEKIINYECKSGDRVALKGGNGSGKTTLLRTLTGEIPPANGKTFINTKYFYLEQSPSLTDMSVIDYLLNGEKLHAEQVRTALGSINIRGDRVNLFLSNLSGGERLKVMILKAIISKPTKELLILDEPTNHIDIKTIESVEKMLNAYKGAILAVSHDTVFLNNINIKDYIEL